MTELENFRKEKDKFFRTHPRSPLSREQKKHFAGLKYYPEDPALRLELPVSPFEQPETIQMQTSTGDVQEQERWGEFTFDVDSQPARLTVYYSDQGGYFVPFRDATSGTETYGAGRYLELHPLSDGKFLVNFNLAYNPYCAYSEAYSCPLPPVENWLKVPIRAGEKDYGDH